MEANLFHTIIKGEFNKESENKSTFYIAYVPVARFLIRRIKVEKREKGFSLIELMVVIAVIAVLVSLAIPTFIVTLNWTKQNTCRGNLRTIDGAIQTYYTNNDTYPSDLEHLVSSGYLKENPEEPFGGQYELNASGSTAVCSKGHTY